jgi:protein gp37
MSSNTPIGWADDSANLWWGCFEPAPETGCKNCYARELAKRYGWDVWGRNAPRRMLPSAFDSLKKFQKRAKEEGKRRRVFVNSMSDLSEILPIDHSQFHEMAEARRIFFENVSAGEYPDLDLIWLTKLIGNVPKLVPPPWMLDKWPANLWLVPTLTNQPEWTATCESSWTFPRRFAV